MRREFGVILQREAIRQSRRWQTYALRFAFSGMLIGMVAYSLAEFVGSDAASLAYLGRGLFQFYIGLQLAVACFVAPILVATGILEEREAKTLDLLAISGLQPQQILNGKVGSRLLALLTIIAAGAPVLALIVSFGGISVWQVLNATINTAVLAIMLGVIGGFCALFARKGPIPPLIGAMLYIVPVVGLLPFIYDMLGGPEAHSVHFSPLEAIWTDNPAYALIGLLYIPVIWQVSRLSLPVFRIATSDESTEEFGLLSPDFWVIERFKRRTWLMMIALFVAWSLWVPTVIILDEEGYLSSLDVVAVAVAGLLTFATLFTGTRFFLMTWMWGARYVRRYLTSPNAGSLFRRRRKRTLVRGNPVTWRELSTRGSAGMRLMVTGATVTLILMALFSLFLFEGWGQEEIHVTLASMAVFLAFAGALLTTTSTIIEERNGRTLPLLLLTPMSRFRIIGGKLMAVWWRALPLLAMALLLVGLIEEELYSYDHGHDWHHHAMGANLLIGSQLARIFFIITWVYGALSTHVLAILLIALLVRPARLAWPAIPFVVGAWWVGPALAMGLALKLGLLEGSGEFYLEILMLWWPFIDDTALFCTAKGAPLAFVAATAVQLLLALLLMLLIRLRLNVLMRIET